MLGNQSGLVLVPLLRAINPAMRIIVFTGFASAETVMEAINLGANGYLSKPADEETILATLMNRSGFMASVHYHP